jgi:hypothetical protein
MGRRKKRDNSRKRSLVFEESPTEVQKHYGSPVFCVDNPITAESVPVDGNVSWVGTEQQKTCAVFFFFFR